MKQDSGTLSSRFFWNRVESGLELFKRCSFRGPEVKLVLHCSGYGYSPDGAPRWLADAIAKRPVFARDFCIVTFFHELYATGWPWRRAFWHSARQRNVIGDIARASDGLLTNRPESARWLERATARARGTVRYLPVPSNVGEPDELPGFDCRRTQAVIFGGPVVKRPFLRGSNAEKTAKVCQNLGISRLVEIGKPFQIDCKPFAAAGIEVVPRGFLPRDEVSRELLDSRIAFFDYFPDALTKSGILAALSSHGVALCCSSSVSNPVEQLLQLESRTTSMQYLMEPAADVQLAAIQECGLAARRWYAGHSSREHAKLLCAPLVGSNTE
ncbi:hypothetical protein [Crateriforma conspicua]|nr:hypothetical protein [Crateriforma conspicua]